MAQDYIKNEFKGNLSIPQEFVPPVVIFPFYGITTTTIMGLNGTNAIDGSITVAYSDLMNIHHLDFISTNITSGLADGGPSGDSFERLTYPMDITVPKSPSSNYTFSSILEIEDQNFLSWRN